MQLTARQRYAVLAMLDVALNQRNGPVSLMRIADRQSISQSYLEQLFTKLRKKNLVKSIRGPGGGYCIAGDFKEITVAQIIQAVDHCIDQPYVKEVDGYNKEGKGASLRFMQPIQSLWHELSLHADRFLNGVTLASLVEQM